MISLVPRLLPFKNQRCLLFVLEVEASLATSLCSPIPLCLPERVLVTDLPYFSPVTACLLARFGGSIASTTAFASRASGVVAGASASAASVATEAFVPA